MSRLTAVVHEGLGAVGEAVWLRQSVPTEGVLPGPLDVDDRANSGRPETAEEVMLLDQPRAEP